MGLDNYFERTGASPEQVGFPENLRLCGGMFSGHGSEGSFRGKVYTEFFQQKGLEIDLYCEYDPENVRHIAEKLSALMAAHPDQGWTEDGWTEDLNPNGYYSVSAQEVRDLAALFQSAAEQKLQLVASY